MKLTTRHLIRGKGLHRPKPAQLLPDEPPTTTAVIRSVVDEDTLEMLLGADDIVVNESALCPGCERTTFHAMHRDGSRRCWTCSTETLAGGAL